MEVKINPNSTAEFDKVNIVSLHNFNKNNNI
jgi:hypothetical protein